MNALKISAFAIASMLMACGGPKENTEGTKTLSGEVKIDGSSTVYPITEAVAEEFRAVQPDIKVTVGLSGTGGGFKKFTRGEIDINNASRSIKQEESEAATTSKIGYLELKVAYDGLTVVVNPENNFVNDMTVEELKMMWAPEAQGKITKWNQIRPTWP
ncbi:MAG: substrate-binding domain-containing protein, partial [Bacteroidota bacterium]